MTAPMIRMYLKLELPSLQLVCECMHMEGERERDSSSFVVSDTNEHFWLNALHRVTELHNNMWAFHCLNN